MKNTVCTLCLRGWGFYEMPAFIYKFLQGTSITELFWFCLVMTLGEGIYILVLCIFLLYFHFFKFFFRIQMLFLLWLYIHFHLVLRFTFIYLFSIIFLHSLFAYTQVSLDYLRHLVILIFCYICLYVRYSYKKIYTLVQMFCWYAREKWGS